MATIDNCPYCYPRVFRAFHSFANFDLLAISLSGIAQW
jgi:hypothetical protein